MFNTFKKAVQRQFAGIKDQQLFRVYVDKDTLWQSYLDAFPAGTNQILKERTEHDCQACRSFIKNAGTIVAIHPSGRLISIWDIELDNFYQTVANTLAAIIKTAAIENVYLHPEKSVGVDKNFSLLSAQSVAWEHLSIHLPTNVVCKGEDIGKKLGDATATKEVFMRGLEEITVDSLETVLELIGQNSLYRGAEHKHSIESFLRLKQEFEKLPGDRERDLFAWSHSCKDAATATRIKNTSIGTLLLSISEGKELEAAVKSFEAIVAPANYKRPSTALVTPAMIQKAQAEVVSLGLNDSLDRRYARLEDIAVTDVIYVDRYAKKKLNADVFDNLINEVPVSTKKLDNIEEIGIEKFLSDVVLTAASLEVLFENRHARNLVSLIAPVDASAPGMFKWHNSFSWSYTGDLADSEIRQTVQARGGRVDGVFRFSHSWNHDLRRNASLMDLHVFMPGSSIKAKNGINDDFGNSRRVGWNNRTDWVSSGVQDVDYVTAAPDGYIPVENITFPKLDKMPEGTYICKIHNWHFRQPTQGGFRAEIEFGGQLFQYAYDKPLANHEWVTVAEVTLLNGQFTIKHHLPESIQSRRTWRLSTQNYHKVSVLCLSPNFWGESKVGNKHYFFMLQDCVNDGKARGFYNEFLSDALTPHRKVLEMVGARMKTDESAHQLSGLGFSSTQRGDVLVKVTGKFTRTLRVKF